MTVQDSLQLVVSKVVDQNTFELYLWKQKDVYSEQEVEYWRKLIRKRDQEESMEKGMEKAKELRQCGDECGDDRRYLGNSRMQSWVMAILCTPSPETLGLGTIHVDEKRMVLIDKQHLVWPLLECLYRIYLGFLRLWLCPSRETNIFKIFKDSGFHPRWDKSLRQEAAAKGLLISSGIWELLDPME